MTQFTETFAINALAKIIGKDRDTLVRNLRNTKPDAARGKVKLYKIATVVAALIAGAATGNVGASGDATNAKAFSREKVLRLKAQRETTEFELSRSRGEYVKIEDVATALEQRLAVVRENLLAVPPSVADEVARACRGAASHESARVGAHDLIRSSLYGVLNAIADGADSEDELRHAAIAAYLDKGAPVLHPVEIIVLDQACVAEKTPQGWIPFDAVDGAINGSRRCGANSAQSWGLKMKWTNRIEKLVRRFFPASPPPAGGDKDGVHLQNGEAPRCLSCWSG